MNGELIGERFHVHSACETFRVEREELSRDTFDVHIARPEVVEDLDLARRPRQQVLDDSLQKGRRNKQLHDLDFFLMTQYFRFAHRGNDDVSWMHRPLYGASVASLK